MDLKIIKKHYIILSSIFISFSFYSCQVDCVSVEGTGPIIEKMIETESFNAVENDIQATVLLNQGESVSLNVYGQSNIIEHLEFKVKDNKLKIGYKEKCLNANYDSLLINITLPELKSLELSGSGLAIIQNKFKCENLDLSISGSGDINVSVETRNSLNGNISGSGSIILKGSASEASFDISGSGEIHAFEFPTSKSTINISGSGDAELFSIETLEASISGSGDVQYKGNPKVSSSISGSGELNGAD